MPLFTNSMDKSAIRAQMHTQRASLSKTAQVTASQNIVQQITSSSLWKQASSVAIYMAFNHEVDITELLNTAKQVYLPSIKNDEMQFQLFTQHLSLETLSYGLIQPKFIEGLTQPVIDLYLIPLLAFDQQGNRLGMGGGFYDRYFATKQPGALAGVAYSCQQLEQLPADKWDVKLDLIYTEHEKLKT